MTRGQLKLVSIVVFLACGVIVFAWTLRSGPFGVGSSVADQWNQSIAKLGIEPLYPPQEDISVGDVFLVVTGDRLTGKLSDSFPVRALKIAHVDMNAALKAVYAAVPQFPLTAKGERNGNGPEQNAADHSIFDPPASRRHLPLVMLPGLSLVTIREASVGLGAMSTLLGSLGAAAGAEQSLELRIPSAETYGVPSLVARRHLEMFCGHPETAAYCTEPGAREELSSLLGNIVLTKIEDKTSPNTGQYRLIVEIYLINRIYLTRSIETTIRAGTTWVGRGNGPGAAAPDSSSPDPVGRGPTADTATGPGGAEAKQGAAEAREARRIETLSSRLAASQPGAQVAVAAADSRQISLVTTLPRPVAIGFRAYRTGLFPQ